MQSASYLRLFGAAFGTTEHQAAGATGSGGARALTECHNLGAAAAALWYDRNTPQSTSRIFYSNFYFYFFSGKLDQRRKRLKTNGDVFFGELGDLLIPHSLAEQRAPAPLSAQITLSFPS